MATDGRTADDVAAELRERAAAVLYGAAEASAVTGGLVEEAEA